MRKCAKAGGGGARAQEVEILATHFQTRKILAKLIRGGLLPFNSTLIELVGVGIYAFIYSTRERRLYES